MENSCVTPRVPYIVHYIPFKGVMSIKGPSFPNSTPDPSPVPPKPSGNSQNGASGKNLAIAAGGGLILFIIIAALATNTSETSTPAASTPSTSSTEPAVAPLWGAWAVATGGTEWAYGGSWDAASEQEAKEIAIAKCSESGGVKCEISVSFGRGHASLATGATAWYGNGGFSTAIEARNEAIKACKAGEADPDTCSIEKEISF